jgi:hypothetical protein
MRMSYIPPDIISLIIHNSLSSMEKKKKELELVQIDEIGFNQNPLIFRGQFTPAKLGHRYYYRSENGIIIEDKFTYSKSEAHGFCDMANPIMREIEEIRNKARILSVAWRVSTNKETREKIEEKIKEKETEVNNLFLKIFA